MDETIAQMIEAVKTLGESLERLPAALNTFNENLEKASS